MERFKGGMTVLMAVYKNDDVKLFLKAVQSVYENSLQPDSFLLVVDGDIPKALSEAVEFVKSHYGVRVLRLKENVGLAMALNEGLKKIDTTWVARADADDINRSDRFLKQAIAINKMGGTVDILGGAILEVDENDAPLAVRHTVNINSDIKIYAKTRNPFNHMTVIYRVNSVRKCGGYPNIYLKEDYALWASMLAAGAIAHNVSDVLVNARTGMAMYRRRGGFRYAFSEIALQRHLVRVGLKSIMNAIIFGTLRAFVFILPPIVRGGIYMKTLRLRAGH